MKISEQERLMLVSKKEEILRLTNEIIQNIHTEPKAMLIRKNVNSILAHISIISSYTDSKSHNLLKFNGFTLKLFNNLGYYMDENEWDIVKPSIIVWCGFVNEIQFKFTEKKALINIPKIDITLFEI